MQVLLTFDVEVWCTTWHGLDAQFPEAFERYIYGRSRSGDFGLPRVLRVLNQYGLKGVFFVETLFAARFGQRFLDEIVRLIRDGGHEVQLHLHGEWVDETKPRLIDVAGGKRQFLHQFDLDDQTQLIAMGLTMLEHAGAPRPIAFRAGNFGANDDTFRAIAANGLTYDSSLNPVFAHSAPDYEDRDVMFGPSTIHGVHSLPVSVFKDGMGKTRPAHIGACGTRELMHAVECAAELGWCYFVALFHNFEMLKLPSQEPDKIVVRRFEQVCDWLARRAHRYPTVGFEILRVDPRASRPPLPSVALTATAWRVGEQAVRRLRSRVESGKVGRAG